MYKRQIEDNDPILFLEPKRLYNGPFYGDPHAPAKAWRGHELGEVPSGHYSVPLGKAREISKGDDVTILAYGTMVWLAQKVAEDMELDADILDLRSLLPLDTDAIEASVKKTGRCVILHEATRTSGFGAELAAQVQERCFYALEAPIMRVTGWDTPYPHAQEWAYFPGPKRVGNALRKVMGG